ncbi:MAG: hypothetical protein U1E17_05985 [Geminicoccaceae bacterium]
MTPARARATPSRSCSSAGSRAQGHRRAAGGGRAGAHQGSRGRFVIVGDDSLPGPDGVTYRAAFERRHRDDALAGAVTFLGKIGDAELLARYAAAGATSSSARRASRS